VHTEFGDIAASLENSRNPKRQPEKQITVLAKIIHYQAWRNSIVPSKRSGFIVKGHGRLLAVRLLKLEQVPIDYQDYDNEAPEWADMLVDNRIVEIDGD